MRRPRSPYSIHPRPTRKKNRWVYYAQFRGEDGGYTSAVSTGCTRRDDAVRWCEKQLAERADQREKVTLAQYVRDSGRLMRLSPQTEPLMAERSLTATWT